MKKCLSMALMLIMLLCLIPTTTVFASTIMRVEIKNIDLPVAGSKPDFSAELGDLTDVMKIIKVEWTEYDDGWEWQKDMTANDTFKEGYWYVIFVYLETNPGHNFGNSVTGTINNKTALISGNSVQANGTKVCFYTSYQATKALTAIGKVDLTVVKPAVGKTPTFAKVDTTQYFSEKYGTVSNCSNGVTWTNQSSGVNITVNNPFKEGTKYKVTYYLTAKDGYKFTASTVCTINGTAAAIELTDHYHAKVSLSDLVPDDGKKEITSLDLTVVKPVVAKTPTFAKVDTTQYFSEEYGTVSNCFNGVTWTNQSSGVNITVNNPFKEGTKYKVTYYLTAKDGYKFTASTVCTINGTAAAIELTDHYHAKVSLSDLVPDDGKKEITSLDLSVTEPKDGEKPTYTKIDATGYYSDNGLNGTGTRIYKNGIAWYKSASSYISPGTTETFTGGSEYTVKISLTAKDGYKFGKSLTARINGKTAMVETFDDGSINVSVKLTALSQEHKHTNSDWKTDEESHWKVCTDTACSTITVAKETHKDANKDNKCDTCGYAIPKDADATTSTPDSTQTSGDSSTPSDSDTSSVIEPTNDESQVTDSESQETNGEPEEEDNKKEDNDITDEDDGNGAWIWMVLAIVIVLAAVGAVTFIVIKRKKPNN